MTGKRLIGLLSATLPFCAAASMVVRAQDTGAAGDELERGFRNPPREARPHAYWLWLNGHVDRESAREELQAMKDAGLGGILMFDMGARGEKARQPPEGPAFLSPDWLGQFRASVEQARGLGLDFDFSVVSSWDMGGHWIEPRHASMGLYSTETSVAGGAAVDVTLPFPPVPPAAPRAADGKPAFWLDVAVLAIRDAKRRPGHDVVMRLDPDQVHDLREAVLDNGHPRAEGDLARTMTPTREFSIAVATAGTREEDFTEVLRGALPHTAGRQRFALPAGTRGRYARLRLLSGHDDARPRRTLGEFSLMNTDGLDVAASRHVDRRRPGALVLRGTTPLGYDAEWNMDNLHDGDAEGPRGVFATAGPPAFALAMADAAVDVTKHVDHTGRLRWAAPAGEWTLLRFVCMNTGERLKVPSPKSDGWATDHLSADATRVHLEYVISRLKDTFGGDLRSSGLQNLYLASYEVRGPVWSPTFTEEFRRRRGYDMTPYLPAVFDAKIGTEENTQRFLFDYRKTLGEVLVDAYYRAARAAAHGAGLQIKSEAGGPGPPIHNVPVDALLANSAVDAIQGEFWPKRWAADGLWVVKETAVAGHIYGKRRVHMEAFTSDESWGEGPQDLKASADRVFCEGGNHMVWHTWAHNAPDAGLPGWAYYAGTHLNRNVTWWRKARPFIDYLARSSFLLQRGRFVADVLYYYGDQGFNFVGPRRNEPGLGPGYDYDVTNADVLLNRLTVRDGRLFLPDGMSYSVLVLPDREDIHPAVLAKLETLVSDGAIVLGPRPRRASGLEGFPASDERVRELAGRLWGDLDGSSRQARSHGKGKVIWGRPLRQVLADEGIGPDFLGGPALDFIHRRDGDADIYFVRNTRAETANARVTFRVADREPELWDPRTGLIERAGAYQRTKDGMEVPLDLAPNGSVFVVFRRPARADAIRAISRGATIGFRNGSALLQARSNGQYEIERTGGRPQTVRVERLPAPLTLEGEWSVQFESGRGAPEDLMLPGLDSWTEHSDPGVRFFSGTARYQKAFTVPPGWKSSGQRAYLDLGRLWTIGEAWLNGKPLGILWTAPFEVDCTEALREGPNELVVEIVNTWHNRLVGDAKLLPEKRITRTNVPASGGKPWAQLEPLESGLFGPVRVVAVAQQPVGR
jgi:hypothetical protein